jgi:hypothetical protein
VRLLSALHPELAAEAPDPDFLPQDLLGWLDQLRGLPAGASFAVLCESLRAAAPERVAELERDAGAGAAMVAEMGLEEARQEFAGALAQLRVGTLKLEIDALAAKGVAESADRERLLELQARMREFRQALTARN